MAVKKTIRSDSENAEFAVWKIAFVKEKMRLQSCLKAINLYLWKRNKLFEKKKKFQH